jgi:hypothetical protein|tara:strand:+ start:1462 stop:1644 length:183 start_codon:yes stop_codon:yes gene_type:complete
MKHTTIHRLDKVTDMELNVLQVALTHLIENLLDDEFEYIEEQLTSAKKLYLDLGGKEFWK